MDGEQIGAGTTGLRDMLQAKSEKEISGSGQILTAGSSIWRNFLSGTPLILIGFGRYRYDVDTRYLNT